MTAKIEFSFHSRIAKIPAETWNALAGHSGPFLRHEFLEALEASGSVCADTGWQPHHLALSKDGRVVAVMPLYIKTHSYGEYVFDWSWADAYRQHGYNYYPKLLTAIPYTPSQAPRLLIASDEDADAIIAAISKRVIQEAQTLGASSWHVLFPTQQQSERLDQLGVHQRMATQFHWFNKDYESFDHYLESFNSRKRKNLRKERAAVLNAGILFEHFSGENISEQMWDAFYQFYENTYHVRGQQAYLTKGFFKGLGSTMPETLLLVFAIKDGTPIAAALSFHDENTLYGRYWGSLEEYQFLHFETCYYQGIEYCIENKLSSFDSGAQGEHKIQRGFEPISTYSNHWIANAQFSAAIVDFLNEERKHVEQYKESAAEFLPFKFDETLISRDR